MSKSENTPKRALVTGGCGFIGSHLVELLVAQGHQVTVVDNLATGHLQNLVSVKDSVTFVEADITEFDQISPAFQNQDWIFHLAALADIVPSINNPEAYYKTNVTGTFNVLQAARQHKCQRFVYTASSSCYGIPDQYPTPESAPCSPQYPYALTKMLGEELALHWAQVYGMPIVSLRLFNVYGLRSRTAGTYGAVLGVFLRQKLAGQAFTIVGDGTQTRDFTNARDVASAFYAAARSTVSNEIFNVGSGTHVSINKLANLLQGETCFIEKRPGEPDCTFADISKITQQLDWTPQISIEEGVEEVLNNIDYWANAPLWTPTSIKEATKDWFKYLS